jgi:hypothetical protein
VPSRFDVQLLTLRDDPKELPIGEVFFTALKEALKKGD